MPEAVASNWLSTNFGSLCLRIVNGGTPETDVPSYWDGDTPWITGADFTARGVGEFRRYVSERGIRASATSVVKQGNLLVVTRTGVGKLAIAPCDIAISQDITGVYVDPQKADTEFVYYLLSRELEELKKLNQGTSINGIVRGDLEKHVVSFPRDPSVQKKLVAIFRSIDSAIEKTEALIAKHQQIKAGLMHDLFTRGVLPNGQLRPPRSEAPELYQGTAVGWIPAEWRVSKLDDVCKSIVDCPHSTPNFQPGGVLVARTMHIKNSVFLEHEASRVSEREYQERISRAEPLPGDVVFTREAPVGEAFVIPIGMRICLGQRVMLIKPNAESLDSDYLVAQIYAGALSTRIAELTAGTTNPHLNVADVRALLIALPSPQEQAEMKCRINAMNARLRSEETILLKLQKQKLGLMQDLLTGRVPVPAAAEPAGAAA